MDKQKYNYLITFVLLTMLGTNIQTGGSNVKDFVCGVMTGIGMVGIIVSLWTIGKARQSQAK